MILESMSSALLLVHGEARRLGVASLLHHTELCMLYGLFLRPLWAIAGLC